MKPHPEYLRAVFSYDSSSGDLYWKFREDRDCQWNGKWAGKKAGYVALSGYVLVRINRKNYKAHRIIWAIVHGRWPENEIDHIDNITSNNRLENLREATPQENRRNIGLRRNNMSGVTGVHWSKNHQKWLASIRSDRKSHHIGLFADKDDAIAARKDAEVAIFKEFQHQGMN
jgi:hypothetical protein